MPTPRQYGEILSPPSNVAHTTPLFTHAHQSNRLSTLEDNVRSLSMTLEDLKKALVSERVSTVVGQPLSVPSMPAPREKKPATTTGPRGRSSSRTRSNSLQKKPRPPSLVRSNSRPPKPAQSVLVPYTYSPEEEAAIAERHSRSLRGVRMMTVQEVTRLCDYVHPPTEILPYMKIISLLLRLQKKDTWTRSDLRSDRKDLWGSTWKLLRPLLGTKQLTDKLARLDPLSVSEETVYLMEQFLGEEEVDSRLGRVSYAAIALAEFAHAFFGLYKLGKGVQDYKTARAHGGGEQMALPLSPPVAHTMPPAPLSAPVNPRNDPPTMVISPVSTSRVPLTVPLPEQPPAPHLPVVQTPHPMPTPVAHTPLPMPTGPPPSVEDWLATLSLLQYLPAFQENEIDLDTLSLLSDKDLEDMGIPIGPKKKMIRSLAAFA